MFPAMPRPMIMCYDDVYSDLRRVGVILLTDAGALCSHNGGVRVGISIVPIASPRPRSLTTMTGSADGRVTADSPQVWASSVSTAKELSPALKEVGVECVNVAASPLLLPLLLPHSTHTQCGYSFSWTRLRACSVARHCDGSLRHLLHRYPVFGRVKTNCHVGYLHNNYAKWAAYILKEFHEVFGWWRGNTAPTETNTSPNTLPGLVIVSPPLILHIVDTTHFFVSAHVSYIPTDSSETFCDPALQMPLALFAPFARH